MVENVVSSLQEAEEVVQSAIATVASKEGLTDSVKAELTDKLEAKAKNIEESIKGTISWLSLTLRIVPFIMYAIVSFAQI